MTQQAPQLPPAGNDPLAQLRDIHTPPPIDTWPPAPGWWILALLAAAAFAYLIHRVWRYWRANRYRREALGELQALYRQYLQGKDPRDWLIDFEALLKRVALTRYPREQVASLTGEAWVAFLDKSAGMRGFTMGPGQVLIDGNYRPAAQVDVDALHDLGRQWIKQHREEVPNDPARPELREAA